MIGAPTKEKKELEKRTEPGVDSFKIGGKLKGTLKDVANMLSSISFLEVAMESNAVNSAYVESRDINNRPYLFSVMKIKKNEIDVVYSIPPTVAPNKRKIDVIRQLLNMLSVIDKCYEIDHKTTYNLIEKAIKDVGELIDKKSSAIYVEYDTIKNENIILKKKVRILDKEVDKLKSQIYELKEQNNEMILKLKKYDSPSDETVKVRIQEWIKDHKGTINIPDFVSVYLSKSKNGETRVEQLLNELVTAGYLSMK